MIEIFNAWLSNWPITVVLVVGKLTTYVSLPIYPSTFAVIPVTLRKTTFAVFYVSNCEIENYRNENRKKYSELHSQYAFDYECDRRVWLRHFDSTWFGFVLFYLFVVFCFLLFLYYGPVVSTFIFLCFFLIYYLERSNLSKNMCLTKDANLRLRGTWE